MKNIFTIMLCLLFYGTVQAQGSFATADTMGEGVTKSGTVWANGPTPTPYHYYKPVLRGHGMMRVISRVTNTHLTDASSVWLTAYTRDGVLFKQKSIYVGAGTTVNDTMWVTGMVPDSMYLSMQHSGVNYGGPYTYTVKYDLLNVLPNDEIEPNGTLATAQHLLPGDSVNGHISYKGTTYYLDENDYYKIVLPQDGTVNLIFSFTNLSIIPGWNIPAPTVYCRAKNGWYVNMVHPSSPYSGIQVIANNGNTPLATAVRDTLKIYGRAKDTINISMYNFFSGYGIAYAGAYTLKYTMSDTSALNEKIPNDAMADAQLITPADTVKGHIAYSDANGYTDQNDYFKIVKPKGGDVKIYITALNKFGYDATAVNPQVFAMDKNGYAMNVTSATGAVANGLLIRSVWLQPFNVPITDTMTVKCVGTDTMYLRVYNNGHNFIYTMRYEYISGPDAEMTYSRIGNEFGFTNLSANANNYRWIMGNGNQYTTTFPPMTSYVPGFYTVKLVAGDNVCNVTDTAAVSFTVAGVEYYTPKSGGVGGDVAFEVYGGGLEATTKVRLLRGGVTITPKELYTNTKKNHLTGILDLHNATPGLYDVIIEVPGQSPITYNNGFRIEGFKYPIAWSQVVAPTAWRINTDNRFKLVVGNNGNVMASGVVAAIVWPRTTQVKWLGKEYKPDYSKNDTLVANGKTYSFSNDMFRFIYDTVTTLTPIDSFEGQPFDGYIRYFLIPHIPAGSTVEIPFIARATASGAQPFITFTHRPNIFGSCPNGNDENFQSNMTAELLDATGAFADKTKVPLFQAFTKAAKIGQKHMESMASYAGKEFWAWADGYETDHEQNLYDWIKETDANNAYAIKTAAQELLSMGINAGAANSASALNGRIEGLNKLLANSPNMSAADFDKAIDMLNAAGGGLNRLDKLKKLFDKTKDMADRSEKLAALLELINNCPDLAKQEDALKDMLGDELTHHGRSRTNSNSVTSMDPNAIYGPNGIDLPQYVNNLQRQPFLVTFENMDTASADAQDVTIIDTLDKTKFRLNSFVFGNVVVANRAIRVPNGRYEFTVQASVPNITGMLVRVNGKIDTTSGIVTWHFSTIDSMTGNRPALHGFLPPNISKPEGEGSISYTVEPLSTVTDGTQLMSTAHIIFDNNDAIATNTWLNTVDILPPTSHIASAVATDTIIKLSMTGTDATSGIRSYRVYAATNSGPWKYLGVTTTDSMIVGGQHDSTYAFYSIAVDAVENMESKSPVAEVSIVMPVHIGSIAKQGMLFNTYPNPANTQISLQLSTQKEETISIEMYNVLGQKTATLFTGKIMGNNTINYNIQDMHTGIYTIHMTTSNGEQQTKKIVIAR